MKEHGFRDQLVVPGQLQLFDYWKAVSKGAPIPSRMNFDPREIPRLLPNICLIDVEAGFEGSRFRLAGTALYEIYGSELTGRRVDAVFHGRRADYWRRIHHLVIEHGKAQSGVVQGPVKGRDHVVMYWLRLPMTLEGPDVRFILGYDFVETAPETSDERNGFGGAQGELPLRCHFPSKWGCA